MERNIDQRETFAFISRVKKIIGSFWFSLLVVICLIAYQQWLMEADLFAPDADILLNQLIYYGLLYFAFHLNMRHLFPYLFSKLKGWWWKAAAFIALESLALFTVAVAISVTSGKMELHIAFALLDFSELHHKKAVLGPWVLYTFLNLGYYFSWQAFQLLSRLWIVKRVRDDLQVDLHTSQMQVNNVRSFQHLWFHLLDMGKELIPAHPQKAVKMINLIQYMLKYHGLQMDKASLVTLGEEWRFMRLLLLLAKLRVGYIQVICEFDRSLFRIYCMPLSLIVIIENMIRHGELTNKQWPATIRIKRLENMLVISTENRIKERDNATHFKIGLPNLQDKLAHYYDGKAKFQAWSYNNTFYTLLEMPIIE